MRSRDISPVAGKDRQCVQRDGDTRLVTQLTCDVLTFVDECLRRTIVSLFAGEYACGKKRAHAQLCGSCRSSKLQQSTQPVPAFGEILANLPIAKQGGAETQAPLRISGFCQPLKRRPTIVMFSSETLQPFCPLRPAP